MYISFILLIYFNHEFSTEIVFKHGFLIALTFIVSTEDLQYEIYFNYKKSFFYKQFKI